MELGLKNHNGDGLLGPNSIMVVYMDPLGNVFPAACAACAGHNQFLALVRGPRKEYYITAAAPFSTHADDHGVCERGAGDTHSWTVVCSSMRQARDQL